MSIKRVKSWRVPLLIAVLLASMALVLYKAGSAPLVSAASCPTLANGSSGSLVKLLQTDLNLNYRNGFAIHSYSSSSGLLAVDGQFGPLTETAVKGYQTANHLMVDGIVGTQTWGSLGGCVHPSVAGYLQLDLTTGYITAELGYATTDWRYGMLDFRTATKDTVQKFRFSIVDCSSWDVTIQSLANSRYVGADLGYSTSDPRYGMLSANATSVGSWQKFSFQDAYRDGSPYPMLAANGWYVNGAQFYYGSNVYYVLAAVFDIGYRGDFYSPIGYNNYSPFC